ncbi:hypothetical protein [Marmoricola sp. URHA0025 HA25]
MDPHTAEPGASGNVIAARDCLVGRIVAELRSRGYYLAHIDSQAGQVLIDLRWAAQAAGRTVGRRTRTYASTVGKQLPEMVTVIVAPVEVFSAYEIPGRNVTRAVIEELLDVHTAVSQERRPA